ncbi:hypothetical protein EX30DRAFT_24843 [Ascodesmis nigricans]|uniref:Uncharacterized protein n=1 Tax=Ascodesmis nigricans TaxID=341454 RepID=A0A4V3SJV9_9PEZI|nr:hypothetical protein EX30DRAFT_24843 [Ascodesmis nigricans]
MQIIVFWTIGKMGFVFCLFFIFFSVVLFSGLSVFLICLALLCLLFCTACTVG